MKIIDYGILHFNYGDRGYSIHFENWKLDMENESIQSVHNVIRKIVDLLLKDDKCYKFIVSNDFTGKAEER